MTEHTVVVALSEHIANAGAQGAKLLSLQAAIDAAEAGDTIHLKPGTYVGDVVVNKELLTIRGDCIDDVIIAGHVQVTADDVRMQHLSVAGGPAASGILVNGARDCKFNTVRCTGNANGMEFVGAEDTHVDSCEFIGNVGYGLKLTAASTGNDIRDCFATGNGHGYGIFDSPSSRLFDCAAHANTGFGLHVVRSNNCPIQSQMAQYNGVGVCFDESNQNTFFTGNVQWNGTGIQFINSDNNFVYSTPTQLNSVIDFDLDAASNTNTIAHNFYNTKTDLGVSTRWQNNHLNTPVADSDVATVGHVKTLAYLATPVTHVLYVDKERGDTYVENGSITKPFKTLAAALAVATSPSTVQLLPGTPYVEDVIVPAGVSLRGENGVVISGDVTLTDGVATDLSGINFTGVGKTLTLKGSVSIRDCLATCAVVYDSTASSQCWNFHILPPTGVVPLTMLSTGKFQSIMASIIAVGEDVPAIDQQGGSLILNTVLATAGRAAGPVVLGSGGTAALIASQAINSLGGPALDLSANDATASNPNMLAGVVAVGNAVCGAKTTMVEGIQFITVGALTGSALLFRPANHLKYAPAVPANWTVPPTTVQDALDKLAAKVGPV
jgi:hypothetical protein